MKYTFAQVKNLAILALIDFAEKSTNYKERKTADAEIALGESYKKVAYLKKKWLTMCRSQKNTNKMFAKFEQTAKDAYASRVVTQEETSVLDTATGLWIIVSSKLIVTYSYHV
jgi:hypothetical protein